MNTFIKKLSIYFTAVILSLVLFNETTNAKAPDFNGGVLNEYTYEEVFFLSGAPVKFSGKATITEKENKNLITTTYKFNLSNALGDKLTRSIVYVSTLEAFEDKGQTTSNTSVKSFSEKVTIGTDTYTLDDFQFSQASVIDNRPATDYYSGNIVGRKIYLKTSKGTGSSTNKETITVFINGRDVGYKNFWGATETQVMDYEINTRLGNAFITSKVSDSKSKILQYETHPPSLSSFVGGHTVINSSNMISEYTYDIPYAKIASNKNGTINLNQEKVPTIERLIVPKFRDLSNHWAKDDIEKLYSLGIFDESSSFFSPNTPMKRYQFTIGVLRAVDLRVLEQPKNKKPPTKAIFSDLDPKDPDYIYIESAVEKGIINGVNPSKFAPNQPITRAQAVAILVRALGLEGRAPSPGFKTNFADDNKIPTYAKESVYVATELGLINGDEKNRFNPNQSLTRAQSAAMIARFLNFLENDLKQNYRDDMLFFD
ncbi:S-layer homology domain-containing protein [Psychrobacillus sp. FSL H8-0484]|uniref:S-layer homology domain-containing protein n=1 Tax=Psychrobacillus sp. FSL H8-0484 TaxID=2921390 RepID=UPI0030FADBE0